MIILIPALQWGAKKTAHLGKSGSTGSDTGSDTQLTGEKPINPGDDELNSRSNKSALTRPTNTNRGTAQSPDDHISENVPGSAPQSNPPTAALPAVKGDSLNSITQSTSHQSAPGPPAQKENSSEPSGSKPANLGPLAQALCRDPLRQSPILKHPGSQVPLGTQAPARRKQ